MTEAPTISELDGGTHDIEYFFDPSCPFAWQTSQWIRRVVELRGIAVGWRFASLAMLNEENERPPEMIEAHERGLRYLRICAAARVEHGNAAVGNLYRAWGERLWYVIGTGEMAARMATAAEQVDPAEIIASLDLPASLLGAADDPAWDGVIRAETDEAMRRAGPEVGTPVITYDPPDGNSLFGPIISEVPDDDTALAFYDAMRTLVDVKAFSELKRNHRAPLDLPLLAEAS